MANNFYEQFMDAQKSMYNTWNNMMNPAAQKPKEEEPEEMDYFKNLQKLNEAYMKQFMESPKSAMDSFWKNFNPFENAKLQGMPVNNFYNFMNTAPMEKMWKNMMGFNQMLMNQSFENPQDIWKKMNASFDNYVSAYQLWKKLTSGELTPQKMEEIYKEWSKQFSSYMKNYFIPALPKEIQDVTGKYLDAGEAYAESMQAIAKPFIDDAKDMGTLWLDFAKNGPKAYADYFEAFQDNAKESMSYIMNSPAVFLNEDFFKAQQKFMDRMVKYNNSIAKYYDEVATVLKDASKEAMDEFTKVVNEGMEPKSFEDFYKFWTDKRNEYVEKAYMSDEFKHLVEETLQAMTSYKEENEDILREYFSFLQIPKKNDMDKLEGTVRDLTSKIEAMNKELAEMKELLGKKTR